MNIREIYLAIQARDTIKIYEKDTGRFFDFDEIYLAKTGELYLSIDVLSSDDDGCLAASYLINELVEHAFQIGSFPDLLCEHQYNSTRGKLILDIYSISKISQDGKIYIDFEGTTVHGCLQYPNGLTDREYKEPDKKKFNWQTMARDPKAFAKGRISHPDHKTIVLPTWHRIAMNTESRAAAADNVAFLD